MSTGDVDAQTLPFIDLFQHVKSLIKREFKNQKIGGCRWTWYAEQSRKIFVPIAPTEHCDIRILPNLADNSLEDNIARLRKLGGIMQLTPTFWFPEVGEPYGHYKGSYYDWYDDESPTNKVQLVIFPGFYIGSTLVMFPDAK